MILFRRVEGARRADFRNHTNAFADEHFLRCFRRSVLGRRGVKDGGAILCPDISALSVPLRRIVNMPEDIQKSFQRNETGFEYDFNNLRMAGFTGAHFLVRRIRLMTAHVSGDDGMHAFNLPESGFRAPEAPGCEIDLLDLHDLPFRETRQTKTQSKR